MKFVLIEFCAYILKTRVTRNRVTGIRVTRGPPVLRCKFLVRTRRIVQQSSNTWNV